MVLTRLSLGWTVMDIILEMTVADLCRRFQCAIHISIDMVMHQDRWLEPLC